METWTEGGLKGDENVFSFGHKTIPNKQGKWKIHFKNNP